MKSKLVIYSLLSALTFMPAAAKSAKRGVSENQFQYKAQMSALEPGVTWYYNWANAAGTNVADFEGMEYVPMCWSGNYNADNIRNYVNAHPETKYLLGFNEPNFTAQANMTPAAAAEQWPAVQALAAELGLKLVAPALNYSPNAPYQDPTKWMDEFVALVGSDAFDYVAIHNYGGFGVMESLATTFHDRYGKDVWLTEFCYWPNEGDQNSLVSPSSQIASMMQCVEWLEKTEWVHRYAWFKAIGNSSSSTGPNYGLLISGRGEDPRELSEQGKVYVYMSEFDPDSYHMTGVTVSAADYISQSSCLLGSSASADNPKPIELAQFSSGASADYQFDVAEAGDYVLTLSVSGQGEPTRFDPMLAIFSGETELSPAQSFTLSGSDDVYTDIRFTLTLPQGKQTLTIQDANQWRPSGIRIATLRLDNIAGLSEIVSNRAAGSTDFYDLRGRRVANPTAPGIYIRNNQKVIIK